MFSVGILYSAQEFLEFVRQTPDLDLHFPDIFNTFSVASSKAMLELSQQCQWIRLNISGKIEITEKGKQVIQYGQADIALRVQIGHLLETYLPPWIPLLSRGRAEAQKYLPQDISQCFREAGLFSYPSDDIVNWWDKYSKVSRKVSKDAKLDVGRQGEKLSLEHERRRTKREPTWQGFESNLAGFDVLSVISETDSTSLRIEVKTSNSRPDVATFYLSKNEWNVASTSDHYIVHLWALQPKPLLIIVETLQLERHIPSNQGDGQWENISIPYSTFCVVTPNSRMS